MKKHIKEEQNENAIQQKSAGTFANDQTQEAQESAQLIQLAAENEEKSSYQALQKLADGQKSYSGGGGGGDDRDYRRSDRDRYDDRRDDRGGDRYDDRRDDRRYDDRYNTREEGGDRDGWR